MSNSIIFDFETLSTNRYNCVVVSLAALKFSEDNFTEEELQVGREIAEELEQRIRANVEKEMEEEDK